ATTGPARGPRPTSSTPAISGPCCWRRSRSIVLQRMSPRRRLLFGRSGRRHDHLGFLFLDARGLAGQLAQVVQLRATHAAAAQYLDVADHRAVYREDALDTDAVGDLPNGERLADTGPTLGDADAFERLNALLVAFLDAHVDAQRVARAERRDIRAHT